MKLLDAPLYIRQIKEHFEAYTDRGEFICSGDTLKKCQEKLLESIKVNGRTRK